MTAEVTHYLTKQKAARDMRALCGLTLLEAGDNEYVTTDDRVVTCVLCLEKVNMIKNVDLDAIEQRAPALVAELRDARRKLAAAEALIVDWRRHVALHVSAGLAQAAERYEGCADDLDRALRGGE